MALRHGCSPVNLLHVFRTPFYKNTYGGLLLNLNIETTCNSSSKLKLTELEHLFIKELIKLAKGQCMQHRYSKT